MTNQLLPGILLSAIRNQPKTGITFHYISKEVDTGSIIEQFEIPLSGYETAKILNEYLFRIGAILFVRLIIRIKHNYRFNPVANDYRIGTYEPPFGAQYSYLSEKNTFQEISHIIRASRIYESCAVYMYSGIFLWFLIVWTSLAAIFHQRNFRFSMMKITYTLNPLMTKLFVWYKEFKC